MAGFKFLARIMLLAALLFGAWQPAAAAPARAVGPACHAYSETSVPITAAGSLRWDCRPDSWQDGQPVTWLRFPAGRLGEPASQFSSRITVFRSIAIASLDVSGRMRTATYTSNDAEPVVNGAVFRLQMPEPLPDNRFWIVRIERPHSVTVQSEARLSHDALHDRGSTIAIAVLCLVLGMLVMPLLFDIHFYVVLRERFVLLHAGMVVAMIAYLLFAGGLVGLVARVPITPMAVIAPLSWAIGVGMAGFFIRSYLEPGVLSPSVDRLLRLTAWWSILVPGIASFQFDLTQPIDNRLYFYGFMPAVPVYSLVILHSLMRGSRAARFLAAAWAPIIVASVERLLRGIGLYAGPTSLDLGMFLAMGVEVTIIALGVADRFLAIRRQRDLARTEARQMEVLSERDPLTGLYNRRMLEERFDLLRAEGFTTLAVVDLDSFKSINDTHGHAMGDRVLQAVAGALEPDDDTLPFRLGGEEFLVLLRGTDAMQRAERLRQALPGRVASDVAGLDRVVTASMGVVEVPRNAMPHARLEELYERADRLLYEAKQCGRNRTVSERMRVFAPRQGERRKVAAGAG